MDMRCGNGYIWEDSAYLITCKEAYINDYDTSIQIAPNNVIPNDILEKLEIDQIDDKVVGRFSLRYNLLDYTHPQNPFVRNQAGFIHYPKLLDNADLVVFFSDKDHVSPYTYELDKEGATGHKPRTHYRTLAKSRRCSLVSYYEYPMLFTSATLWEQTVHRPKNFAVAVVDNKMLQLPTVEANTLLWTNKYELPPIPIATINKLGQQLAKIIRTYPGVIFLDERER